MVLVNLKLATICFLQVCYPALLGGSTPIGEFELSQRMVLTSGYGGDILQFKEDDKGIFAVHRVWVGNPKEQRLKRLNSPYPEDRKMITNGCINVSNEVYEKLLACCSNSKIKVIGN